MNLASHRLILRAVQLSLLALLLVLLLPNSEARAAGDSTRNENAWMVGLDLLANTVGDDEDDDELAIEEGGAGGALQFGYRFTPRFLLRLYASGAVHETDRPDVDVTFSGGLIEAVYLFRPGQAFRPYVFGGLGGYRAEAEEGDFTYSTEGPGASFGGGMYYWFTPHASLHGSARIEAVNWDEATVTLDTPTGLLEATIPVDDSGSAGKLTLGMAFWF